MKVIKTTFEEEQRLKEEAWLNMRPEERLSLAIRMRKLMRKPGVNYSYQGSKVKVSRAT